MATPGFFTTQSLPSPYTHVGGGTAALSFALSSPLTLVWADGKSDSYGANTQAVSIYDRAAQVDGGSFVWLVVCVHGQATPFLVKEADGATIGTLVDSVGGGEWALYARIDGDQIYRIPQI